MSHRYQTLISPFVLPNGVVLKNRMVHPKCAPDQTQGPEDWPTAQTAFFYSDAARRGNALVMMHVRNSPDVRKMPDTHDFAHSYTFDTDNPMQDITPFETSQHNIPHFQLLWLLKPYIVDLTSNERTHAITLGCHNNFTSFVQPASARQVSMMAIFFTFRYLAPLRAVRPAEAKYRD